MLKQSKLTISQLETSLESEKSFCSYSLQNFAEKEEEYLTKIEKITEKFEFQLEKQKSLNSDLAQEKNNLEEMISCEREYIQNLEKKINEVGLDYNKSLEKSEERDSDFVHRLSDIMKENTKLHQKNQKLRFKLQEKDNHILTLQEDFDKIKIEDFKEAYNVSESGNFFYGEILSSQKKIEELYQKIFKAEEGQKFFVNENVVTMTKGISELNKEISSLKEKTIDYEHQITSLKQENNLLQTELNTTAKKLSIAEEQVSAFQSKPKPEFTIESFKDTFDNTFDSENSSSVVLKTVKNKENLSTSENEKIKDLNKTIQGLNEKIALVQEEKQEVLLELSQIKCKLMQDIKLERIKIDEVDLLLEKFCFDHMIDNFFIKIFNGVYIYMSKQVSVSIKNGNLLCKHGGFSLTIDEFLKNELFIAKKKMQKNIQSALKSKKSERLNLSLNTSHSPKSSIKTSLDAEPHDEKIRFYKEKIYSPIRKQLSRK